MTMTLVSNRYLRFVYLIYIIQNSIEVDKFTAGKIASLHRLMIKNPKILAKWKPSNKTSTIALKSDY